MICKYPVHFQYTDISKYSWLKKEYHHCKISSNDQMHIRACVTRKRSTYSWSISRRLSCHLNYTDVARCSKNIIFQTHHELSMFCRPCWIRWCVESFDWIPNSRYQRYNTGHSILCRRTSGRLRLKTAPSNGENSSICLRSGQTFKPRFV